MNKIQRTEVLDKYSLRLVLDILILLSYPILVLYIFYQDPIEIKLICFMISSFWSAYLVIGLSDYRQMQYKEEIEDA